jgi:putative ABC transport system ATP-binding protein
VTHDPELARRAQRNVHLIDGQISDFRAYEPRPAAFGSAAATGGPGTAGPALA